MFEGKEVSIEELEALVKMEEELPCESDHEIDKGKPYWHYLHTDGPGEWYLIIECPCDTPATMLVCQGYKDIAEIYIADAQEAGKPHSCLRCGNPVTLRCVKKGE